ncbi:MAG TPA: DoxX family protein [Alphaproteobacteria bacterium]|nr:DoxX family protein [Alphaproteobacteria bacterium]
MAEAATDRRSAAGLVRLISWAIGWLDGAPSWIYEAFFRIGLAFLFGYSGWNKLARWDNTLKLFRDIYKVPLLPPETAAVLTTAVEVTVPFLFLLGLGTRFAAAVVFAMTVVIQIFVVPKGYHVHALWLGPILYLMLRGPGILSLDQLIRRKYKGML